MMTYSYIVILHMEANVIMLARYCVDSSFHGAKILQMADWKVNLHFLSQMVTWQFVIINICHILHTELCKEQKSCDNTFS